MTSARILIVDDDREIARLLTELLERYDYRVEVAHDAAGARRALAAAPVDLLILDVKMPGETGIDLCRQVRATSRIPIIMLTAVSHLVDRVVSLEVGADDYVTKPFEGREIVARIRALLRRTGGNLPADATPQQRLIALRGWTLDLACSELRSDAGILVPLTLAEFDLLQALARRQDVVMSREWLMETTRGSVRPQQSRNVDVLINRLRSKMQLHEGGAPLIETVRQGGYLMRSAPRA
jgi:two-component system OmpR family response regulator